MSLSRRSSRFLAVTIMPFVAGLAVLGASPTAVERVLEERLSPRFRAELGDDFDFKLAAGRALTLDEAVALALPSDRRTSTAFEVARA
jgi:hypothetical protein